MSLINDMLRDLDQRKTSYPQQGGDVRVTPVENHRAKRLARRWVWLVASIGLLFILAFGWHLFGEMKAKVVADVDQLAEPAATTKQRLKDGQAEASVVSEDGKGQLHAQVIPVESTPVQQAPIFADIQQVEVQETINGGARIEITLSIPVQHRVTRHAQQLMVELPNTRLAKALPNLTRHALIRAVDAAADASGMLFSFTLSEPVELQTSLLSGQQTQLIVELTKMIKVAGTANESGTQTALAGNDTTTVEQLTDNPLTVIPAFEKTPRLLSLAERDQRTHAEAQQLIRTGRLAAAEKTLQTLLQDYPQAHRSRATLIAVNIKAGKVEQAQQLVEQGLQLAPQQLAFIKLKARLLLAQQQPAAAATLLSAQLQVPYSQAATDQELLALLASATQRGGQHRRAADLYQQLLALNHQQPQWWVGLGISLEALEQRGGALDAYRQARSMTGISPALLRYAENRITQLKR